MTLAKAMPPTKREQVCIFNKFPRASGLVISLSAGQFQSVVSGLFRALNATRSLLSLSPDIPHNLLDIPRCLWLCRVPSSFSCASGLGPSAAASLLKYPFPVYIHRGDVLKLLRPSLPPVSVFSQTLGGKHCERVVPLPRKECFPPVEPR